MGGGRERGRGAVGGSICLFADVQRYRTEREAGNGGDVANPSFWGG